MKRFSKFIQESYELDEAVEVSHDRYMRSHGKKASGGHGMWMFTHKRMGDANVNDPKEVHSSSGKFSDAKKSAQQWAKKHGHSTVYVMEEVELDEAAPKMKGDWLKKERERNREHDAAMGRTPTGRKKPVRQMTSTQKSLAKMRGEEVELDEAEMSLYDKIKAARKNPSPDKPVRGRGSKNRNPKTYDVRNKLDKEDDYTQDLIKKRLQKKNEEVELDEVSASTLRNYVDKARADKSRQQKARTVAKNDYKKYGIPSDKERADAAHKKASQRNTGISMAKRKLGGYTKGTEPKVLAREEVELDEVSDKKLDAYRQKAFADQPSGDDGSDKYRKRKFGRDLAFAKQTGRAKVLATKEEVELDEVLDTPKAMDSYRNKAKYSKDRAANSAAAKMLRNPKGFHSTDTSDELNTMDKRTKGLKMADRAAARKTRAMIMKKEEVELDEVSTEKLRDYASAALQDKNKAKADKRWKYAGKAMQTVADREVKAAHARKYNKMEEVDLDEAKTDTYHKHMLKALGKSRLPKDHSYTSAIANNGDFVVKDGGGRTVGRIPKGEHNLKD